MFLVSLLMKRIGWLLGELLFFFQLVTNHELYLYLSYTSSTGSLLISYMHKREIK